MAQVYVPDDPRVREQLEQGGTAAAREEKRMPPARRRRFGVIDLVVFLGVVAAITLLVLAASRWTAPLTPNVAISLSPAVLPAYAGYSLLRMLLAYLLSLVFTLIYGHVAANNRRAERVMIPLLDILQSVPILSFLPAVTLTLVALFPHSNIGLELASVILIFTSQALEAAPRHVLPEEHVQQFLETHFGEQEAQEQLQIAINWGRYAELFAFQEDRGMFRLEEEGEGKPLAIPTS